MVNAVAMIIFVSFLMCLWILFDSMKIENELEDRAIFTRNSFSLNKNCIAGFLLINQMVAVELCSKANSAISFGTYNEIP